MFRLDEQLDLMRTWGDIALDCMTATAELSTAMMGLGSSVLGSAEQTRVTSAPQCAREAPRSAYRSPPKSWYRAPERSPFEVFGAAWGFPLTMPAWPQMVQQPFGMLEPFQPWTSLFGWPHSASLWPTWWPSTGWPVATHPWMTAAMGSVAAKPTSPASEDVATFATYRSNSGHAVAQIRFPNDVVAAVAVPTNAAPIFDTLFGWPKLLH